METQKASLVGDLDPDLPVEALQDQMKAVERAKELIVGKQHELEVVNGLLSTTRRELETAAEAFRTVGRDLMAARETVADLQPPLPESDDNHVRWKELMAWVDRARLGIQASLGEAETAARVAATDAATARERLIAELGAMGIEAVANFAVHVAREQEQAKQAVKEMEKSISLAAELAETMKAAETSAAIAHSLASHLRADGFERWLMAGAVTDLVAGANDLLAQLSGGGSLSMPTTTAGLQSSTIATQTKLDRSPRSRAVRPSWLLSLWRFPWLRPSPPAPPPAWTRFSSTKASALSTRSLSTPWPRCSRN